MRRGARGLVDENAEEGANNLSTDSSFDKEIAMDFRRVHNLTSVVPQGTMGKRLLHKPARPSAVIFHPGTCTTLIVFEIYVIN